jgi:hypothetical protein
VKAPLSHCADASDDRISALAARAAPFNSWARERWARRRELVDDNRWKLFTVDRRANDATRRWLSEFHAARCKESHERLQARHDLASATIDAPVHARTRPGRRCRNHDLVSVISNLVAARLASSGGSAIDDESIAARVPGRPERETLGSMAMFLAADLPMAHAMTLALRSTDTKVVC